MAVGGEVERELEAVVESLGFDLFRSKQRAELGEKERGPSLSVYLTQETRICWVFGTNLVALAQSGPLICKKRHVV